MNSLSKRPSNPSRIGLILVHGIGDQKKHEHLENVTRHFLKIIGDTKGVSKVSVNAYPGYRTSAPVTLMVDHIGDKNPDTLIDIHEVWWRDLGDERTYGRIFRFWAWIASIAGTRGQFGDETEDYALPDNTSATRKRVGIPTRLRLFLTNTFFFVMLAPLWLASTISNMIPGLPKIRLLDSIYSYMSSIKLFQELNDNLKGTLEDFDQPRRFSIQRKVIKLVVEMHRQGYDRWYIAGHSLGSVIAVKAIFAGDVGFARMLDKHTYDSLPAELRIELPAPIEPYPDEPKCPNWLRETAGINASAILSRCRGFIAWGSPLETFARTWPATLPMHRHTVFHDDFEWINIYDAADPVASPLSSFSYRTENSPIRYPTNISVHSHLFIALAHTRYLHTESLHDSERKVGNALITWMLGEHRKFSGAQSDAGLIPMTKLEESARRAIIILQCVVAFAFGFLLWPKAAQLLLGVLSHILGFAASIIDKRMSEWVAEALRDATQFFEYPITEMNWQLSLSIVWHVTAALLVAAALHYLLVNRHTPIAPRPKQLVSGLDVEQKDDA